MISTQHAVEHGPGRRGKRTRLVDCIWLGLGLRLLWSREFAPTRRGWQSRERRWAWNQGAHVATNERVAGCPSWEGLQAGNPPALTEEEAQAGRALMPPSALSCPFLGRVTVTPHGGFSFIGRLSSSACLKSTHLSKSASNMTFSMASFPVPAKNGFKSHQNNL